MTQIERETTLRKIQKLFALAGNNPNEKEAYAAMLKAQELLLQHGLTMEQVEGFEDQKEQDSTTKEESVEQGGGKLYGWQQQLMGIIAKNFRCKWFINRTNSRFTEKRTFRTDYKPTLFGQAKDVDAAKETINFVFKVAPQLWKHFYKTWQETPGNFTWNKSQTYALKNDYFAGFAAGLKERYQEQVQSKDLIIVVPNAVLDEWRIKSAGFVRGHGRSSNGLGNQAAYGQGFRDGKGASEKHRYIGD